MQTIIRVVRSLGAPPLSRSPQLVPVMVPLSYRGVLHGMVAVITFIYLWIHRIMVSKWWKKNRKLDGGDKEK